MGNKRAMAAVARKSTRWMGWTRSDLWVVGVMSRVRRGVTGSVARWIGAREEMGRRIWRSRPGEEQSCVAVEALDGE